MATKPSIETILETYSLDELFDLAKLKSSRQTTDTLEAMKKHLGSFIHEKSETSVIAAEPESKKTEPQKKQTTKPMTLGDYVLEVLGTKPLKIDEIVKAILTRGYKTQSKDLKNRLAHELMKQLKKNTIIKMGYGLYARK